MVEGPAVTLGDDDAPAVRIDALEMFVDLLARSSTAACARRRAR
jgi:hypothetical protein